MTLQKFVLDRDGQPQPEDDIITWASWMNRFKRIATTNVGRCKIATVFLGMDARTDDGDPWLFETMVYGGKLDRERAYYATSRDAAEGHAKMVKRVEESY